MNIVGQEAGHEASYAAPFPPRQRDGRADTNRRFAAGDAGDLDELRPPGRSDGGGAPPGDPTSGVAGAGERDNAGGQGEGGGLPEGAGTGPGAVGGDNVDQQSAARSGDAASLAKLTGEEIAAPGLSRKDRIAAARAWFDEHLRPLTIKSEALGRDVGFTRGGRNKSTNHLGDGTKGAVIPAIPAVIKDGRLVSSEAPRDTAAEPNVKAYHTLQGRVDLAGKPVDVREWCARIRQALSTMTTTC